MIKKSPLAKKVKRSNKNPESKQMPNNSASFSFSKQDEMPMEDLSMSTKEIDGLLKQYEEPIIPTAELQRPDPELLKDKAHTPKWLIQWCILKSSTGCHKCRQKLEAIQQFEAAEEKRKAELERIAIKNEIIKSKNEMIQAKIDMMQAKVDIQKRTPYLLGQQKKLQDRRTSSWKSIFNKPLFDAFKK